MKKHLLLLLWAITAALTASAYDFSATSDGTTFYFNITGSSTAEITYKTLGVATYSGSISLPAYVSYNGKSYNVNSIGSWAFLDCTNLTSVRVTIDIRTIKGGAFQGCTNLTDFEISQTRSHLNTIGLTAFSGCKSLSSITIPDDVTSIGQNAFENCSSLSSVSLPQGITAIEPYTFRGCTSLSQVRFYNVATIGSYAFDSCTSLQSVNAEKVTTVGNSAFSGCTSLSYVYMPKISTVGEKAFYWCLSLKRISLYNLTSIGNMAFGGCGLEKITIPSSVTAIGNDAFRSCSDLLLIGFQGNPNNLSIGSNIFPASNYKLKYVVQSGYKESYINDKNFAADKTFGYNPSDKLKYDNLSNTEVTVTQDMIEHDDDDSYYVVYNSTYNTIGNIVVPEACFWEGNPYIVTEVSASAFSSCTASSITFAGNTVNKIGSYAFNNCRNLTSMVLPASVSSISDGTFNNCIGLAQVKLPNTITSIGSYAFAGCSALTSIDIPAAVTSIRDYAFSACSGLTSVTVDNINPADISLGSSVFQNVPTNECAIYVPIGSKTLYAAADQWKDFTNINEFVSTTSIAAVEVDTLNEGGIYYDLMGRRVSNPTPGIYIRNGKKVVVR